MAMGLRGDNLPQEIEKEFLLNWIPKNLPRYTATELKCAFDLAAAKKIDVEHHYQKFSVSYLGQLMKAYEEQYRTKVVDYMNKNQAELNKPEPPTPSERKKIREAFVVTCLIKPIKNRRKAKGLFFPCSLQKVYSYFLNAGLIELSEDEKTKIKNRNLKKLKESLEHKVQRASQTPQEHAEKKEARELLKPENSKLFEKKLQDICRMEVITLICDTKTIEQIEKKLTL